MSDPSSSPIDPFFAWRDRFGVGRCVASGGIGAAAVVHELGDLADQIVGLRSALNDLRDCGAATPAGSHLVLEQLESLRAMLVDRSGMLTGAMPWYRSWQSSEAF